MAAVGCGDKSTPSAPTSVTPSASPGPSSRPALQLVGDPESAAGATWTSQGTVEGVAYDLSGILRKPRGAGPFPAVILSHGAGGSANGYSRSIAAEMVGWGLVCIATNYTHAGGVSIGAPGGAGQPGASEANVLRAHAVYEILRSLGYVDMSRVAAHGHSMGAFVTAAYVGTYPFDVRVASHTAGGVRPGAIGAGPAPVEEQVRGIRVPYQAHHGDRDVVVALAADERFVSILSSLGVVHELHVYAGADHDDVPSDPVVLQRVKAWYARHGLF
jgi:dienelactone hydrolase